MGEIRIVLTPDKLEMLRGNEGVVLIYDTEESYLKDLARITGAKPDCPICINQSGQVRIDGTLVDFTSQQLEILKILQIGGGRCSRLDALDAAIPKKRQIELKSPEEVVRLQVKNINDKMAHLGWFIDHSKTEYFLYKF